MVVATPDLDTRFTAAVESYLTERMRFAQGAGFTFGGRRDLWGVCGYPETISVADYRRRYERGGIAGRIVDALPKATWRGGVELIEDDDPKVETEFEQAWGALSTRLDVIPKLQSTDILSRLSTFSVLLIGAEGDASQPLPRATRGQESVLYFTPYCGQGSKSDGSRRTFQDALQGLSQADAIVHALDEDPTSPRFGLPTGYRLRRTDFASTEFSNKVVHHTRVIHVAEGALDDEVYTAPALERGWNLLDDLDKVVGGGSEAFYQRANQGRVWKIDKDVTGLSDVDKANFAEQIEKFQHNQTRDVRMRGVEVEMLGSDVANFSNPADAIETLLAGSYGIPKRILTGSEMGELASSQDRDNWRDQVNGRREQHAWPYVLKKLVDRLVEFGYLPKPKQVRPRWGSVMNLTEAEKREKAQGMATVNAAQKNAGLPPVYLSSEIRDFCHELLMYAPEQLEAERELMPEAPAPQAFPRAASAHDASLVEELATAIEGGDLGTVDRIIGVRRGA